MFVVRQAALLLPAIIMAVLYVIGQVNLGPLLVIGFMSVAILIGHEYLVRTRFACPDCGARTEPPARFWTADAGERLLYRCHDCEIDWDLGLRGTED